MNEAGISQRQLGKMSGVSNTTISKVLSGQMDASWDFCAAIAKSFDERPETVLRIAGLLPPSGGRLDDLTQEEAELIAVYKQLSEAGRELALYVISGFIDMDKKGMGKR